MRILAAITLLVGGSAALADGPSLPLSTIQAINKDGPGAFPMPVRVRGVVTYCDVNCRRLFIQDGESGMSAHIPADSRSLRPGQRVELAGKVASAGSFEADELRLIGDGRLPDPVAVMGDDFATRSTANVLVTLTGVIHWAATDGERLTLRIVAGHRSIRVCVLELLACTSNVESLVDAEVQVKGVSAVDQHGTDGEALLVQTSRDLEVTHAAPELPFHLPLSSSTLPVNSSHRIRISGKAAEGVRDGVLTLLVDKQAIRVVVPNDLVAHEGEQFDVVGFPSRREGQLFLDDVLIRGFAPAQHSPNVSLPIIQSIRELRRMPPSEIAAGYPVRLHATVTYFFKDALYVHDGHEGISVILPPKHPPVTPGSAAIVEGYLEKGEFAPSIRATRIDSIRERRWPESRLYGHEELLGGRADSQWVEIEATVRGPGNSEPGEAVLMLRFGPGAVPAHVAGVDPAALAHLYGATVRIHAVCGSSFNSRRQWTGLSFLVPGPDAIRTIHSAPPDLSVLTPMSIDSLSQFDPDRRPGEPVKISGRVISRRGNAIMVQDSTGGIIVELQPRQPGDAGDRVEVLGFLVRRANGWALEDSQCRLVAAAREAPGPVDVDPMQVAVGGYAATLIRVEATLLDQFPAGGDQVFLMQSVDSADGAHIIFPAVLAREQMTPELLALEPGTRLRVSGACGTPYDRSMIASFRMLLRDANDIEVVAKPSWWTATRAFGVVGITAAVAIVALAWVVTLRRRVHVQTDQISRRLKREAQLEARYRELFESAGDAIFALDAAGVLTDINQAGRILMGLAKGDSLLKAVTRESLPVARELLECVAPITREITLVGPDGPTVLEVSARPAVDSGSSTGVQAIARDLTQRRRIEADQRQAQKMEAIGRLAGGVAHDFNNLLTVINGNAEVLRTRLNKNDTGLVDEIARAGEHAATLTRQLLTFSRKEIVAPRILCPNSIISTLRKMLGRLLGARVELIADLDEEVGNIRIDPGQLEQVLVNLAINARDAMPTGGSLTIRTRAREDSVFIEVVDNGLGMDAATVKRAFEPFFTTKAAGEGTGLGLATVKSIVEQAGGSINVQSECGRGTAFIIEFPSVEERPMSPKSPVATPPPANREVILLVEDEPAVQLLERRVLEMGRYDVMVASSGEEALCLLDRHQGRIDLLVTDVVMPGMSGRELAEAVMRRHPGLPALFLSGYTPDEVLKQGIRSEATHFLQKPFTPSSLLAKVRDVLTSTSSWRSCFGETIADAVAN